MRTLFERQPPTPQHHVLEAMSLAPYYAAQFQPRRQRAPWANFGPESDEDYLMRITQGQCGKATLEVIAYLSDQVPHMFRKLMMIGADNDPAAPFKVDRSPLRRFLYQADNEDMGTYDQHWFFLVLADQWYAGSPANDLGRTKTPLTTLYSSVSLEKVLADITSDEGSQWPSVADIDRLAADGVYQPPVFEQTVPTWNNTGMQLTCDAVCRADRRYRSADGSRYTNPSVAQQPAEFEVIGFRAIDTIQYQDYVKQPQNTELVAFVAAHAINSAVST